MFHRRKTKRLTDITVNRCYSFTNANLLLSYFTQDNILIGVSQSNLMGNIELPHYRHGKFSKLITMNQKSLTFSHQALFRFNSEQWHPSPTGLWETLQLRRFALTPIVTIWEKAGWLNPICQERLGSVCKLILCHSEPKP